MRYIRQQKHCQKEELGTQRQTHVQWWTQNKQLDLKIRATEKQNKTKQNKTKKKTKKKKNPKKTKKKHKKTGNGRETGLVSVSSFRSSLERGAVERSIRAPPPLSEASSRLHSKQRQ